MSEFICFSQNVPTILFATFQVSYFFSINHPGTDIDQCILQEINRITQNPII
jgi:hypothetical protein